MKEAEKNVEKTVHSTAVPAYEFIKTLKSLIWPKFNPLPSGMPEMLWSANMEFPATFEMLAKSMGEQSCDTEHCSKQDENFAWRHLLEPCR